MKSARMYQYLHVRNTVKLLQVASFAEVKEAILKNNLILTGANPDRYTAMVLSVARGHTNDLDVIWH
jgi:hypothetical protein